MSGPIRERITTALDNIVDLLALALPAVPPEAQEARDVPPIEQSVADIRAMREELEGNAEEIRLARADWVRLIERMAQNERPAENDVHANFVGGNGLAQRLREANIRLRELRTLENRANAVLAQARLLLQELQGRVQQNVNNQQAQNLQLINQLQQQLANAAVGHAGVAQAANAGHAQPRSVKLPDIQLVTFKGDGTDSSWADFWELFRAAVDEDAHLPAARKLIYLKSKLEAPAKDVIGGMDATNANYPIALDLLRTMYGSDEAAIRNLHQELINIKAGVKFQDDVNLQTKAEKVCRQLANLRQDVNSNFVLLCLQPKLTKNTCREVLNIKANKLIADPNFQWNTQEFRNALDTVIKKERIVQAVFDKSIPEIKK